MPDSQELTTLLHDLDEATQAALGWFETGGRTAEMRVGEWGPKETLSHVVFWHQATIEGIQSVAKGGPPYRLEAVTDVYNARAVADHSGEDILKLSSSLRALQEQLAEAAQALPELDAVVRVQVDGSTRTARQQLQRLSEHLREHLEELQRAAQAQS